MSYGIWAFLFICTLCTSLISAVVGMGGGVILLSLMTIFLPLGVVIPIHGMVQLFSNGIRVGFLRKHVRRDFLFPYLLGVPLGIIPSVLLIRQFDNEAIPLFLVATLIMYTLFRPRKLPSWKINPRRFFILGVVVGFFSLFIGATGPLLAPFFIRDDLRKEEVVATKSSMQIVTHVAKIPSFLYLDFPYQDYLLYIFALTVAAWIGTKYGVRLLKKLEQNIFEKLFKLALFTAGVRLYYKIFAPWW